MIRCLNCDLIANTILKAAKFLTDAYFGEGII